MALRDWEADMLEGVTELMEEMGLPATLSRPSRSSGRRDPGTSPASELIALRAVRTTAADDPLMESQQATAAVDCDTYIIQGRQGEDWAPRKGDTFTIGGESGTVESWIRVKPREALIVYQIMVKR